MTNWPRWSREPLVHFLLAGAALFLFFAWQGEEPDPASRSITVSEEDRARLSLQWERTMSRAPTDAELDALTDQFVREEVLYREALRLGLDQDDAVIRKRLATKMDFLAASMAETAQPSDEVLEGWLKAHPERFARDARISFDQIYFGDKDAAARALAAGIPAEGWEKLGEPLSLDQRFDNLDTGAIEARLGRAFLDGLADVKPNARWVGPVASGFGWHVVRVRSFAPGTLPSLADVRRDVENDWRNQTMATRKDNAYQLLRDAYRVEIDK